MTTLRTAAQQALEALDAYSWEQVDAARAALRAALAEPVQQGCDHCNHPLYAATKCRVCGRVTEPTPPQRKPLTEKEIDSIWDSEKAFADIYAIARAVEQAHGIKE